MVGASSEGRAKNRFTRSVLSDNKIADSPPTPYGGYSCLLRFCLRHNGSCHVTARRTPAASLRLWLHSSETLCALPETVGTGGPLLLHILQIAKKTFL